MYLVELDTKGLVKVNGEHDGIRAIKEFRAILDDKDLGVPCLTAIALYADWLTPIRYYSENDRPKRAMQMVTGSREAFDWYIDKIQAAIAKYKELIPNPDLIEKENLDMLINRKLKELKEEEDDDEIIKIFKYLETLKGLRTNWEKEHKDIDIYVDGPVRNGYKISRLEEKRLDKNSFYSR